MLDPGGQVTLRGWWPMVHGQDITSIYRIKLLLVTRAGGSGGVRMCEHGFMKRPYASPLT